MSNNIEDGIISSREDLAQYFTDSTDDPKNPLEVKLQNILIYVYQGRLLDFASDLSKQINDCERKTTFTNLIKKVESWADQQIETSTYLNQPTH